MAPDRIYTHRFGTWSTDPDGENMTEYVRADLAFDVRWKIVKGWNLGVIFGRTLAVNEIILEKRVGCEWIEVDSSFEHHFLNKESWLYKFARRMGWK